MFVQRYAQFHTSACGLALFSFHQHLNFTLINAIKWLHFQQLHIHFIWSLQQHCQSSGQYCCTFHQAHHAAQTKIYIHISRKFVSCLSFWKTAGDPTAGLLRKLYWGSWKLLISATNQLHQRVREEGNDTEETPPRTAHQGWAALGPGWPRTCRVVHTPREPAGGFCATDGMI